MTWLLMMCINLVCLDINRDVFELTYPQMYDMQIIEKDYAIDFDFWTYNRYWFESKNIRALYYACYEQNNYPDTVAQDIARYKYNIRKFIEDDKKNTHKQ